MANDKENTLKVDIPLWVKALPILGLGAGLFYAYKKKKSPMGYVGFGLLGGFVGGIIATPIALKKGAKAIGDNLTGQMKDSVSKMATPTNAPASTPVASKRDEMLKKLTTPTGGKVEGGSMSIEIPKELFATLTDKELEIMISMGELEKSAKSKEEAEKLMNSKGINKKDVENIMKKLQQQSILLESKLENK